MLDLAIGRVITRHAITQVPMSDTIVSYVEKMAARDGIKNIKFDFKTSLQLTPITQLAGVGETSNRQQFTTTDIQAEDDEQSETEDDEQPNKPNAEQSQSIDHYNIDDEHANESYMAEKVEEESVSSLQDDNYHDNEYNEECESQSEALDSEVKIMFEEDENEEGLPLFEESGLRRSSRLSKPVENYEPSFKNVDYQHLIVQSQDNIKEYDNEKAQIAPLTIHKINMMHAKCKEKGMSFVETYSLKKGLKKFGEKGHQAAYKEMKQLHDRVCFEPINPNALTPQERRKAMESLIFLTEKRDGKIKARACANGSVQRKWMDK